MSNMLKWAEEELKRYNFTFYGDEMDKAVLEVLKTLISQDHSGMSASIVIQFVDRLWAWKPLTPLTGEDDEWHDVQGDEDTLQNKRYSSVFKEIATGECYDINGRTFVEPNDPEYLTYHCKESRIPVEFPYMPPDSYPTYRLKYSSEEVDIKTQLENGDYEVL